MENLLSHAFDNLSSIAPEKIPKGLRQIDAILAQICLSKSTSKTSVADKRRSVIESSPSPTKTSAADKRRSMIEPSPTKNAKSAPPNKQLSELRDDAAFRTFFKLQDRFEWNVATKLVATLDKLWRAYDEANDKPIAQTLELIQGVLLLHPPSRRLFSVENNMTLLIELLYENELPPRVQSATLHTLVTALLATPQNTRLFESLEGLKAITSLLETSTSRSIKLLIHEFLYFYLMSEKPSIPPKLAGAFASKRSRENIAMAEEERDDTKTTHEKKVILADYLGEDHVDNLVSDLETNVPYDGLVA